nr:DUF4491 family protein [Mobilisporobacter senegalensis]
MQEFIISSILAIFGCTCIWSIIELKEQRERVNRGWFPKNPKRIETKCDETNA